MKTEYMLSSYYCPVTTEEKAQKKNNVKARKTRFGGNEAIKKTQKTLLKQMYENFSASKWNTYVVVWRNKPDLDTISIDDLCNNFKIVKQEFKGTASSNLISQNIAFVSSPSTNSTNEVFTANGVSTASNQSSTASTQVSTASSQTSTANLSDATSYMAEDEVPTNMALMAFSDSESKNASKDIPNELKENPDALLVEDRVSDTKDCSVESLVVVEKKTDVYTMAIVEFVRPKQQEKPVRKPVKYAEMYISQGPRRNQRNWNIMKSQQLGSNFVMYNKACFVCESFKHVHANCNYHQKERLVFGNNNTRVTYNNSTRKTHLSTHRKMAPRAVLIKTGLRPLNTARPVNTAHPKTTVNNARPMLSFYKLAQSTVKRPYQQRTTLPNKIFNPKVNTAKGKFYTDRVVNTARPRAVNTARPNSAVVNTVKENKVNAVKASTCCVWRPTKPDGASTTLKRHNYIDVRGRFKSVMAWVPKGN
nr:ribonuclease H-like domain-containing protein [Tanacetum cinerariifolium]